MKKVKDPNRLKFRDYFGTTTMGVTEALSQTVMTSLFMLYLTDYAGIGKWGAILGSALLLFARLFDAVNDPLEGWLMDRAPVGKHGKYRPFILISIVMISVGLMGLFSLPSTFANSPVLICVWVFFFYLMFDIGASFYAPNLIYRTITTNPNDRGKLIIGPRMLNMLIGMVGAALIAIIEGVNRNFNNMHTAFSVTITVLALGAGVLSLIGLAFVKERHHTQPEEGGSVKLTDIFLVLKENDALRVRVLEQLFSGFIWTFLFATATYYIKWAFCTDLSTGIVDSGKFGVLTLVSSMLMFLPLIFGTLFATPIMKKIGSPLKFHRILLGAQCVPCAVLFAMEAIGVLRNVPALFLGCMAVVAFAIGLDFIPGEVLKIECMDFGIYKTGKDRSALCNACSKFIEKAQSALSSSIVGLILISIGYEVDSATDAFLGELSSIPTMLTWFIVIMGLVPAVLGAVSLFIIKKYPINDEIRADMRKNLDK